MSRRVFGRGLLLVGFLASTPAASAVDPADDAEQAVVRFHAGHTAWVGSLSTVKGEFKGRPVNLDLVDAELMVLALHQGRWLIPAIHWCSSRAP